MPENIITIKQLLAIAHERGLESILTEPVEMSERYAFFRATVTLEGGKVFMGHADAAPNNVKPAMLNCLPRLAETRAIARALRLAVNIGEVSAEELPDYTEARQSARRTAGFDRLQPVLDTQRQAILNICKAAGRSAPDMEGWSAGEASDYISKLQKKAA